MKKVVSFDVGYKTEIDDKIKSIQNAGFDGVFIFYNDKLSDDTILKIINSGLFIESIHLPYRNLINNIWMQGNEGEECVEKYIEGIKIAHKFNIKTAVMHVSASVNPPGFSDIGISRFMKILEECEKMGVFLAVENIKRLDYLDFVFDNCHSPNLKFCFDIGHANVFTKNLDKFPWYKYKDKLWCVHLHDNDGREDLHLIPFMGEINWKEQLPKIFSIKECLNLTLELYYFDRERFYENINEREFMKLAFEKLTRLESIISVK